MLKETVNIRVFRDSLIRIKVRAAKKQQTIMEAVDDLSKHGN